MYDIVPKDTSYVCIYITCIYAHVHVGVCKRSSRVCVCVCVCVCVQEFADELCLRRSRLPPEPASVSDATVLISLRLPSGDRMERRFNNTDQLQVIAVHTYTCTTYYITHVRIVCVYMCLYHIVYVLCL